MKKFIISLSTAFWLSLVLVMAQDDTQRVKMMGGGGFTLGYGHMNVSALQSFLPDNVTTLHHNQILLGGTGHAYRNKLVIGGSGSAIVGDNIKTSNFKISSGGGLGTFDIGYLLSNKERVKIYPLLGVGGGGYGITIAQNEDVSVDDIASDPGREISITVGGFVIDASLNVVAIPVVQYDEKDNSYGGFMSAVRIGYMYSFPSSDWTFSGGDVNDGPNFGINMFYVKLVIGGFGYSK